MAQNYAVRVSEIVRKRLPRVRGEGNEQKTMNAHLSPLSERPNPDGAADGSSGVMFTMSMPLNGVAEAPARRHSARVVSHGVVLP